MDNNPITFCTGDKLIEICFQMFDHVRADGMCLLTSLTPIWKCLQRVDASLYAAFGVSVKSNLKRRVCYCLTDTFSKLYGHWIGFLPIYSPRPSRPLASRITFNPAALNASTYSFLVNKPNS